MNNKILLLTTLVSLVTLTGCVTKGGTSSSSLRPTVQNQSDASAIEKDSVLAMPIFRVNFKRKFDAHARQESAHWRSSSSVSQHVVVETVGFDEAALQDITNQAYQDLMQRLTRKKLNVMPINEAFQKSAALRTTSASTEFPEVDDEQSIYLAEKTMYPTGFLSASKGKLLKVPADVFKELKAGLITVDYTVDFVASKAETDSISGWNSESMSVEIELSPAASVSGHIQLFGFADGGCAPIGGCYGPQSMVHMNKRAISSIAFGKLENTTSTGSKVAQGAVQLLGMFSGSGSKSSFDNYTLTVEHEQFVKATIDALKKANAQLVSNL